MIIIKHMEFFAIRKWHCTALQSLILLTALASFSAHAQLRYDTEYPVIGYGEQQADNRFTRLMQKLTAEGRALQYDAAGRGYLDSLLQALDIDPSSQMLVWSKTSLKQRFINPENPRSLFFNDDVYVGFVPGSSSLEVGVMDAVLGPVFYDFYQNPEADKAFKFETTRCLRCHDSYSLSGGGVPRFLLSSVLAGSDGNVVSHEMSEITDTATPLRRRWGGWYVTGTHGEQETMANYIVRNVATLTSLDLKSNANRTSLAEYVNLDAYARATSDIVALLVLEHQVEVQNRITRLNFESRTLLADNSELGSDELDTLLRPLLDSLFMAHEAPLTDTIVGSSGYKEYFEQQGPADSQGQTLRQFDLATRTFHYPLSYLIYSDAIRALADPVRNRLFAQIKAVLNNSADSVPYPHINADMRSSIRAILQATYPEVVQ